MLDTYFKNPKVLILKILSSKLLLLLDRLLKIKDYKVYLN